MITNPLFQPHNVRAQYRQGMPASLAYALMPTDNFAQKRADSAAALQYQSMAMGLADQAVTEKEKALRDTQESLGLIDKQAILQPDMKRLNEMYTQKWRTQMEGEIANQYGGDIVRFKRERQPYYASLFNRELASSPDFQQALANKTNYALAQDAKSKGKLIVGDFDTDWANYSTGKSNSLAYRGAYDAPKTGFDYFDKNTHPTNPYGLNGQPVQVSQSDLMAHLLSQGLSGDQASDYIGKIGYRGGRYWKMDSQKPWDASEQAFDQQMDSANPGLRRSTAAEQARHNRAMEANARAEKQGDAYAPTIVGEIYNPAGAQKAYKTPDGQVIYKKPGATGKMGDALIRAAGVKPQFDYASSTQFIKDADGKDVVNPDYDRKVFHSQLNKVYSVDHKQVYQNKFKKGGAPEPFRFDSIDPSTVYYYGGKPYLHGVARINGQPREVSVPIQDNELTRGELTNQAGMYNTKDERRQFDANQEDRPRSQKQRTSVAADIDNF